MLLSFLILYTFLNAASPDRTTYGAGLIARFPGGEPTLESKEIDTVVSYKDFAQEAVKAYTEGYPTTESKERTGPVLYILERSVCYNEFVGSFHLHFPLKC